MRSLNLQWLWLVVLAWPASALAEPHVVVQDFKGPSGWSVRSNVVKVLQEHGVDVIPGKKAKASAKSSGADLNTESGRVRVAKKLKVQAFVTGKVKLVKKKLQIDIQVFNGSDGMPAGEYKTSVVKKDIKKEIQGSLWPAIGSSLNGGAPPAEPELDDTPLVAKEPVAEPPRVAAQRPRQPPPRREPPPPPPPVEEETDSERPPGVSGSESLALEEHADQEEPSTARPPAFDLALGAFVGSRSFGYNDSLPGLRVYSLGPSPNLALHGHWYPAAHFSSGVLAHIGLDVRADVLVGVSSKDKSGQEFSTSSHGFGIGVRGRIPLDKLELGAVVGFGQRAFSLAESNSVDPDVPNISHNFLRIAAEGRYQLFTPLAVQLRLGFLYGLSLGELSDPAWFPHATGNGLEGEIGLQLAVTRMFAVELALGLQRYFMSLNPEESDPGVQGTRRVAGGALDHYYSSRLGVIFRP